MPRNLASTTNYANKINRLSFRKRWAKFLVFWLVLKCDMSDEAGNFTSLQLVGVPCFYVAHLDTYLLD